MQAVWSLTRHLLGKWHPDPITAIVTIVLVPLGFLILRTFAKSLKTWVSYLLDGILYWASRSILRSLAAQLSLKRYCKLQLGRSENRFLHVPSKYDITLDVDDTFITLQLEHHSGTRET